MQPRPWYRTVRRKRKEPLYSVRGTLQTSASGFGSYNQTIWSCKHEHLTTPEALRCAREELNRRQAESARELRSTSRETGFG